MHRVFLLEPHTNSIKKKKKKIIPLNARKIIESIENMAGALL